MPLEIAESTPRQWAAPLLMRWGQSHRPIPMRVLKPKTPVGSNHLLQAPPWWKTGREDRPFDFCGHVRLLIEDVVAKLEPFRHIDPDKILLGITRARKNHLHGLQARITPLRFARGELTRRRRGMIFQVQRWFVDEREYLYLLTFCLPRFLDQEFDDKFVTILHELFHISPNCDGDLRRHDGRYQLHTHSQREYDEHMGQFARAYLSSKPNADLHAFLRLKFPQLCYRHGGVQGMVLPRPKIVPIGRAASARNEDSTP